MFVVLPVMNEFDVRICCSSTCWYQLLPITTSCYQLLPVTTSYYQFDRTSVLGPCLDRHFRIAMAIAQGLEGHQRERERERDSLIVAGELDTEGSL